MATQLQQTMFENEFKALDSDESGFVTAADYEQKAKSLAELQGTNLGSPEYKSLNSQLMNNWNELQKAVDKDGDGKVTLDEYIAFSDSKVGSQNDFENYVIKTASSMFEVADTDKNGTISLEEYQICSQSFNVEQAKAEEMFAKYDTDGDGSINKEELLQSVRDFYNEKK